MTLRLKKLELSGFKSFAKSAHFDFPRPITAIVGPNGSGKSNVAEAIRWVLGEQSLKSLRGRKGEDLIFNGSQTAPRLSKASVSLYFDNTLRQFPIEFDEVVIGRRVYRDGQGEYLLNGSPVRLKDIIELLGNVGLGVSQHHIIGQGEADRILYSSPKERQSAIEDALGLKVYQFKRLEAEKKLLKTEENMRQARALQKEIKPHLKHLERLVEKYNQTSEIKSTLEESLNGYLSRFKAGIEKSFADISRKKSKPAADLEELKKKTEDLKKKLEDLEEPKTPRHNLEKIDGELQSLREHKTKIERDLGRLEGMIEADAASKQNEAEVVSKEEVEDLLLSLDESLTSVMDTDVIDEIYSIIQETMARIKSFLSGFSSEGEKQSERADLTKKKKEAEEALARLKENEKKLTKKRDEQYSAFYSAGNERHLVSKKLFEEERRVNELQGLIRSLEMEEEKTKLRKTEFDRELEEAKNLLGEDRVKLEDAEPFGEAEREKARKETDRLKFRLEEVGFVDKTIVGEYEEVKNRDEFFSGELEDLGKAAGTLRQISKELGKKIEQDFDNGMDKINKEFQKFFETMFGGGKAGMIVIRAGKHAAKDEEFNEDETAFAKAEAADGGVDIDVALPRKKTRGLDMLSGGERALTSIALLFALSTVNPPPFLVLDETDAALDESNSRRYAEVLKSLSQTTQFITITHNRETMRQAGALYGVTMGSDGVSRLLSLKLSEAEEITK